jgi:hypothetical protein
MLGAATATTKGRAGLVVAFIAVCAVVFVSVTAVFGSPGPRSDGLSPHMGLAAVVAEVKHGFGDGAITSASVDGSVLSVKLSVTKRSNPAAPIKAVFEAHVLAHAVADWMRLRGRAPITAVAVSDMHGGSLEGYGTTAVPVQGDPSVSPLSPAACLSAARPAATGLLSLASARTVPFMHGACVFVLKTSKPLAGSTAAIPALARMIQAIGPPNLRPFFFELVTRNGIPVSAASWMPDGGGTTWAKPGFAYALGHD